ncbi:MAG: hypothetical protein IPH66_07305 [Crocinitomicaceae bacterium]|nr:hypothetical protein [Crocinitomicaceae bacterium]
MKTAVYYFLFCFAGFYSCASDTNQISSENENLKDSSTTVNVDTLSDLDFTPPAGWILAERFASDDNEYTFCPNGSLIFNNHVGMQMKGTWNLQNDSLKLHYTSRISQIGQGKPLPPPAMMPGNYVEQYESYEENIETTDEVEYLIWSEILDFLSQDSLYPYEIVSRNFKCD